MVDFLTVKNQPALLLFTYQKINCDLVFVKFFCSFKHDDLMVVKEEAFWAEVLQSLGRVVGVLTGVV